MARAECSGNSAAPRESPGQGSRGYSKMPYEMFGANDVHHHRPF